MLKEITRKVQDKMSKNERVIGAQTLLPNHFIYMLLEAISTINYAVNKLVM